MELSAPASGLLLAASFPAPGLELPASAAPPAVSLYVDIDAQTLVVSNPRTQLEHVPIAANLRHDALEDPDADAALEAGRAPAISLP